MNKDRVNDWWRGVDESVEYIRSFGASQLQPPQQNPVKFYIKQTIIPLFVISETTSTLHCEPCLSVSKHL